MDPYAILQCLLLLYISGHATAGIFSSFRYTRLRPKVPEMKPIKFEMKPLKFDSTLFNRDVKLNFDSDAFKPLLGNKNRNSRLGSSRQGKEPKSGIQETNFGGSENNGKPLPLMNDQQIKQLEAVRKRLNTREEKVQTPKNGKNDPGTGNHQEGSVKKTLETNLESSKNNGKHPSHKNDQELDLSETNGKELKVEAPEKSKNGHPPHIHLPHQESSDKTTESFLKSFKNIDAHLPQKNNGELDLFGTNGKGLKVEMPEKDEDNHPPHVHAPHKESLENVTESSLESIKKIGEHLPKNDKEIDLSETNEKDLKEETPGKEKNDHVHHKESSADDDSKETQNQKYKKPTLSSTMNQKSDNVTSIDGSFQQGRTFDVMFYIIIGFTVIIILFFCFKKCRKPQQPDDLESILL